MARRDFTLRRGAIDITYDILSVLQLFPRSKVSEICLKCNLGHYQMMGYIEMLIEKGCITLEEYRDSFHSKKVSSGYSVTSKGLDIIKVIEPAVSLIRD